MIKKGTIAKFLYRNECEVDEPPSCFSSPEFLRFTEDGTSVHEDYLRSVMSMTVKWHGEHETETMVFIEENDDEDLVVLS